ncbi:FUSC family protein [Lapidilactobacillus dextrinicus]|uniref:FUSC family protein n=1 Tax=Lapidilactobacillus dextrinicus TaxID=51664 RepID=UPI003F254241
MTIYQQMQYNPTQLRQMIRQATGQAKHRLVVALVLRSFLILLFAIIYISLFSSLFGQSNSYVGVGSFCILLSLKFINYGYHIIDSVLALLTIFSIFLLNSFILTILPIWLYFVVNFSSLFVILLLTTTYPEFGNGGVYAFSYILITSNSMTTSGELTNRTLAIGLAAIFCMSVLIHKHHQANQSIRFHHILKNYSLKQRTYRWQLRLAIGITIALTLGQIMRVPRVMWMGYACMSILLPQEHQVVNRGLIRILGVVLGSTIFIICLHFLPSKLIFLLGPIAGLGLGLTGSYFWASVLNCFGALSAAYLLLGVAPAGILRISNNLIGLICGLVIALLFQLIHHYYQNNSKTEAS